MRAVVVPLAAILLAFCAATTPARAQADRYSYLRIEIAGHPITNILFNEKYAGWLQIEGVDAKSDAPVPNERSHASPTDPSWHPNEKDGRPWTTFQAILRSGRSGLVPKNFLGFFQLLVFFFVAIASSLLLSFDFA
jgi:hypothetical protein